MQQTFLNNKLVAELVEKIEKSDRKSEIKQYICEVADNCATLCKNGESLRVLNEYKLLFDNLRKELNI